MSDASDGNRSVCQVLYLFMMGNLRSVCR
jgi:hypothetical protein